MNKKNRSDANSPEYDVSIRLVRPIGKKLPATNYQDGLKLEYIDSWLNTGNIHIGVGFIRFFHGVDIRFDCEMNFKQNEKEKKKIKFENNKMEIN